MHIWKIMKKEKDKFNTTWEFFSHFTKHNINLNNIIKIIMGKRFKNNATLLVLFSTFIYGVCTIRSGTVPDLYIYIFTPHCPVVRNICIYIYICVHIHQWRNWSSDYLHFFLKYVPTLVRPQEPDSFRGIPSFYSWGICHQRA